MLTTLILGLVLHAPKAPEAKDVLLDTLVAELERSTRGIKGEPDAPLYYLSYRVTDFEAWHQSASFGALEGQRQSRQASAGRLRMLDVSARVGTPQLDNTHRVRGSGHSDYDPGAMGRPIPIEDDAGALSVAVWRATHEAYRTAAREILKVRANVSVKAAEENQAPDFSRDPPQQRLEPRALPLQSRVDVPAWEERLRRASALFKSQPRILRSSVTAQVISGSLYFVDSEGARVREPRFSARVMVTASVRAPDGMELDLFDSVEASSAEGLPGEAELGKRVQQVIEKLLALERAPAVEPYVGPAIISHRAAGVFFHEIFGHRVEGHRQKDADEGHTFTKRVGKSVVPDFIGVVDDPTAKTFGEVPLNGQYLFDEEGQPAQRVTLVEKGVLKNFLMGRSPIEGFAHSNGHGRAMAGLKPVARQGNLMVTSTNQLPPAALRKRLIDEVKARGKPYGLLFDEISGGFTNTRTGGLPQAFKVIPQIVYRVYPDGRPDELVRGVDLVGTPLSSFERILATGDDFKVFNGTCGAESGWVPVSAVAPSLLVSDIEVERRASSHEQGPLLPPPPFEKGGAQ